MDVIGINFASVLSALVFLAISVAAFAALLKPFTTAAVRLYRREIIEERNVALALLVGLLSVSLSILVASAVH